MARSLLFATAMQRNALAGFTLLASVGCASPTEEVGVTEFHPSSIEARVISLDASELQVELFLDSPTKALGAPCPKLSADVQATINGAPLRVDWLGGSGGATKGNPCRGAIFVGRLARDATRPLDKIAFEVRDGSGTLELVTRGLDVEYTLSPRTTPMAAPAGGNVFLEWSPNESVEFASATAIFAYFDPDDPKNRPEAHDIGGYPGAANLKIDSEDGAIRVTLPADRPVQRAGYLRLRTEARTPIEKCTGAPTCSATSAPVTFEGRISITQ